MAGQLTHKLELADLIRNQLLPLRGQVVHDLVANATEELLLPARLGRHSERREHLPDGLVLVVESRADGRPTLRVRLDEVVEEMLHAERQGGDRPRGREERHEVAAEPVVQIGQGARPAVDGLLSRGAFGSGVGAVQIAQ